MCLYKYLLINVSFLIYIHFIHTHTYTHIEIYKKIQKSQVLPAHVEVLICSVSTYFSLALLPESASRADVQSCNYF